MQDKRYKADNYEENNSGLDEDFESEALKNKPANASYENVLNWFISNEQRFVKKYGYFSDIADDFRLFYEYVDQEFPNTFTEDEKDDMWIDFTDSISELSDLVKALSEQTELNKQETLNQTQEHDTAQEDLDEGLFGNNLIDSSVKNSNHDSIYCVVDPNHKIAKVFGEDKLAADYARELSNKKGKSYFHVQLDKGDGSTSQIKKSIKEWENSTKNNAKPSSKEKWVLKDGSSGRIVYEFDSEKEADKFWKNQSQSQQIRLRKDKIYEAINSSDDNLEESLLKEATAKSIDTDGLEKNLQKLVKQILDKLPVTIQSYKLTGYVKKEERPVSFTFTGRLNITGNFRGKYPSYDNDTEIIFYLFDLPTNQPITLDLLEDKYADQLYKDISRNVRLDDVVTTNKQIYMDKLSELRKALKPLEAKYKVKLGLEFYPDVEVAARQPDYIHPYVYITDISGKLGNFKQSDTGYYEYRISNTEYSVWNNLASNTYTLDTLDINNIVREVENRIIEACKKIDEFNYAVKHKADAEEIFKSYVNDLKVSYPDAQIEYTESTKYRQAPDLTITYKKGDREIKAIADIATILNDVEFKRFKKNFKQRIYSATNSGMFKKFDLYPRELTFGSDDVSDDSKNDLQKKTSATTNNDKIVATVCVIGFHDDLLTDTHYSTVDYSWDDVSEQDTFYEFYVKEDSQKKFYIDVAEELGKGDPFYIDGLKEDLFEDQFIDYLIDSEFLPDVYADIGVDIAVGNTIKNGLIEKDPDDDDLDDSIDEHFVLDLYDQVNDANVLEITPTKVKLKESVEEYGDKWNIGSNKLVSTDSQEYANLVDLAKLLQERSANNYRYEVKQTYEDFGAGMEWYNIICITPNRDSWQVLNTRDWLDLANGKPIEEVYNAVVTNKYFQDKPSSSVGSIFKWMNDHIDD